MEENVGGSRLRGGKLPSAEERLITVGSLRSVWMFTDQCSNEAVRKKFPLSFGAANYKQLQLIRLGRTEAAYLTLTVTWRTAKRS